MTTTMMETQIPEVFAETTRRSVEPSSVTVPLEWSLYSRDPTSYAVLETHDVTATMTTDRNSLRIVGGGLVRRILLRDFPLGQYTLSLNNQNCATARFDPESGDQVFDFVARRSEMLTTIIGVARAEDEPVIEGRDHYCNLSRVDSAKVLLPRDSPLNGAGPRVIGLEGYFLEGSVWRAGTRDLVVFPGDTHQPGLNHPTVSLAVVTDDPQGTIAVRVDGITVPVYELGPTIHVARFRDPSGLYRGAQNRFLSDEINRETINMSRVNDVEVITSGCRIHSLHQHRYQVYRYPERFPIFSS